MFGPNNSNASHIQKLMCERLVLHDYANEWSKNVA